jgi:predicted membrane protein
MLGIFRVLATIGLGLALAAFVSAPFWGSKNTWTWSDFLLMAIVFWGLWFIAEMMAYSVRKEIEKEKLEDRQ